MHLTVVSWDDDEESDESDDELSADCDCQLAVSPQRCCTLTLCQPSAFCSPLVCTTSEDEWSESDDEELSLLLLLLLDEPEQEQSRLAWAKATHKAMQKTSANFILAVD
jgi:hypothetical protein